MSAVTESTPGEQTDNPQSRALRFVLTPERAMTIVAIALIVMFSVTTNTFLTSGNLIDTAASMAFATIVAVGMTLQFIGGEFDLSLGALFGFSATLIAYLSTTGWTPLLALLAGLMVSLIVGLINGLVTTKGRVPSFIVTIGMLSVLQGLSLYLSGGYAITLALGAQGSAFAHFASGHAGTVPVPVIVAVGVLIVSSVLLKRTRLGAHIYLTGGNRKAAAQAGISPVGIKVFCFVFAAGLAGIAGAFEVFSLGSAEPQTGLGNFLFQAAGAAIIGGVALTGGEGSIYGTFVGAVILGVLNDGLALSGVNPGIGILLTGALIILAGALNAGMREGVAAIVQRARIRTARRQRTNSHSGA